MARKVSGADLRFEAKMAGLSTTLYQQLEEAARVEAAIGINPEGCGHGK